MRQASSRSKPPADERVPLLGVDFRGQRGLRRWRSGVFDLRQSYMSIIGGLLLGGLCSATDRNRLVAVIQFWRTDDCCRHYRSLDFSELSDRCTARTSHSTELSHRVTKVRSSTWWCCGGLAWIYGGNYLKGLSRLSWNAANAPCPFLGWGSSWEP